MSENEPSTPEPTPEFSRRSIAALRAFLRPYYWKGGAVLGLTLVGVALDIVPVHLLEQILDRAVRPRDTRLLFILCSALLGAVLLRETANTVLRWVFFSAAESFLRDMRMALYERLLTQSQAFYRGRDVGEIASRLLNDLQSLQRVLSIAILSPFANGLFIIGMLGYLFTLDWHLALVILVVLPVYALTQRPIMNRIGSQERRMREDTDALAGELVESLQHIEEVQSCSVEPRQRARMDASLTKLRISSTWLQNLYGFVQTASGLVSGLASLSILAIGGYLAATDRMTAGALVAFVTATVQILRPVEDVMNLTAQLTGARVLADRIGEFLLAVPDVQEHPEAKEIGKLTAAPLQFSNVTFGYQADQPILRDFDLSIAAGERVALVGPSGSGKSTVLHLVRRFFDVQQGLVTIDGRDVKGLKLQSLRRQIATVNQRPSLFHGTIRDNIALGWPASEIEIHAAATAAHLDGDLMRIEGGLDFNVGPDGGRLSGGQRQRVALARAILRDAPVLLLDEATSALDADSQAAVLKALDAVLAREPRKTCIVVAHRLSTVRSCDKIVLIERGRVAESGTYDELIRMGGKFAALAATELESEPS